MATPESEAPGTYPPRVTRSRVALGLIPRGQLTSQVGLALARPGFSMSHVPPDTTRNFYKNTGAANPPQITRKTLNKSQSGLAVWGLQTTIVNC